MHQDEVGMSRAQLLRLNSGATPKITNAVGDPVHFTPSAMPRILGYKAVVTQRCILSDCGVRNTYCGALDTSNSRLLHPMPVCPDQASENFEGVLIYNSGISNNR